jgi:hypothetical protein
VAHVVVELLNRVVVNIKAAKDRKRLMFIGYRKTGEDGEFRVSRTVRQPSACCCIAMIVTLDSAAELLHMKFRAMLCAYCRLTNGVIRVCDLRTYTKIWCLDTLVS